MREHSRGCFLSFATFVCAFMLMVPSIHAEPVKIRVAYSSVAEEALWLLVAKPELSDRRDVYVLEATHFPAADKRLQALEAGAVDMASVTANSAIFAAGEGIKMKAVASLAKEGMTGFTSQFLALDSSPIKTPRDLKGKTIGIVGFSGTGHLYTKIVLEKNGVAESEVTLANVRFPAMAESLKAGKIDVGLFPQPFAAMAEREMKLRTIFTARDAAPFDQELMILVAKEEFLKKNERAIKAFLADLKGANKFYNENTKVARQILLDKKFVGIPAQIYLELEDYLRDPSMRVDLAAMETMQELQIKVGFQKNKADLKPIVDNSYVQ